MFSIVLSSLKMMVVLFQRSLRVSNGLWLESIVVSFPLRYSLVSVVSSSSVIGKVVRLGTVFGVDLSINLANLNPSFWWGSRRAFRWIVWSWCMVLRKKWRSCVGCIKCLCKMEKWKGQYRDWETHDLDRKSTRLNSSHEIPSRMPSSA